MAAAHLAISGRIAVITRKCDLTELDAYIASAQFMALFAQAEPKHRRSVFAAYNTARQACLTRLRILEAGTRKANWQKPGEVDRFLRLWDKCNGDRLQVASAMRITEGAVKMAVSRFITRAAKPGSGPDSLHGAYNGPGARSAAQPSSIRPESNAAVRPYSVAA